MNRERQTAEVRRDSSTHHFLLISSPPWGQRGSSSLGHFQKLGPGLQANSILFKTAEVGASYVKVQPSYEVSEQAEGGLWVTLCLQSRSLWQSQESWWGKMACCQVRNSASIAQQPFLGLASSQAEVHVKCSPNEKVHRGSEPIHCLLPTASYIPKGASFPHIYSCPGEVTTSPWRWFHLLFRVAQPQPASQVD